MRQNKAIKYFVCSCFFVFCILFSFSREPENFFFSKKPEKSPMARTRLSIAPLISFYKINPHHAANPNQKMSGYISLKEEIRLNERHTAFFLIGAEYMIHGLSFFSYYFKPDSIQLYDGEFRYKYDLTIHELDIPLQLKFSFTRENNSRFSPYCMIGYHFRTLLTGKLKVHSSEQEEISKNEKIVFKNPLITPKNNPFVSFTFGFQRNWPNSTRNCLFAELSYRVGFSPYLLSDTFTPSSLYINGSHLALGLGIKF